MAFGSITDETKPQIDSDFTINQFEILRELCKQIKKAHENVTFHGHNEVDKFRTCPNFNYKQILNLDANGNL